MDRSIPPSETASRIGKWVVRIASVLFGYVAYEQNARWWTVILCYLASTIVLGTFWFIVVVTPLKDSEEGR